MTFHFLQSLFHTVKEWKSLARVSLKCRFSLCEARAKLKWNLKVDSPAVTLAYSSKSPINFAKISLQFIERKSLYILPINLDMEVQFVHWPWLFPNPFSHFLHCVTQLRLETLDKLSSSIFCCLSVCQASVAPGQIFTFSIYTYTGTKALPWVTHSILGLVLKIIENEKMVGIINIVVLD